MTELRFTRVDADAPDGDALLADWRHVHNTIIPTDPLSADDVRARSRRNRLDVAHLGDTLVGCSTVRPPDDETPAATVIARILPAHRRQGLGRALYEHALAQAAHLTADGIETIVLASNHDGLEFARARGFVEVASDLLPGDTVPYLTLALR
ncbi:GNAT family N-acetyltransferase [Kitasatospora paranensis]|uniref:GNAT family N-acetyltransferase n=1 Tax=Kitasatospora paranensis TaxID=258053 RepID=A0ABW2G372_9ACTN